MMLLVAIALLQSAEPVQTSTSTQPPEASVPAAPAEEATDAPEMKMKRVCRKVIDPRVGTLGSRQTVCKYVQDDGEPAKPK